MARPFVQEFANFALAEEAPRPTLKTEAHCAQVHLIGTFKPLWATRVPYGYLMVYPEWLAFLSDSTQKPGSVPDKILGEDMLKSTMQVWKYAGRFGSVSRIARDAFQQISTTERDRLKALIANPNSVFVPMNTIASVAQTRATGIVVMLEITTTDGRDLRLAPNPTAALGPRMWKGVAGAFGGTWEPKLQAALKAAVAKNQGTPERKPEGV